MSTRMDFMANPNDLVQLTWIKACSTMLLDARERALEAWLAGAWRLGGRAGGRARPASWLAGWLADGRVGWRAVVLAGFLAGDGVAEQLASCAG